MKEDQSTILSMRLPQSDSLHLSETKPEISAGCPTGTEAIRAAVQVSARTASYGRAVQVVVDEPGKGLTVIWDSTRDGFSRA